MEKRCFTTPSHLHHSLLLGHPVFDPPLLANDDLSVEYQRLCNLQAYDLVRMYYKLND